MTRISAALESGRRVRVTDGKHTWFADEPTSLGGADSAPDPYELLLGSLAACTCVTLAMYAEHKRISLRRVETSLEFDRIHADDCEECEEDAVGLIDRIGVDVRVQGTFTDAERARLTQVATRCPVHKTLASGVVFADAITFVE
jgi:putative redox protein